MSKNESNPTGRICHHDHLRLLVAASAGYLSEEEPHALEPEIHDAVQQTIETVNWLIALKNDAYDNYRGGTLEKVDIPIPEPPPGNLVTYIPRTLHVLD